MIWLHNSIMRTEKPSIQIVSCRLPTEYGEFALHALNDSELGKEHVALTLGSVGGELPVLTRLHSEWQPLGKSWMILSLSTLLIPNRTG